MATSPGFAEPAIRNVTFNVRALLALIVPSVQHARPRDFFAPLGSDPNERARPGASQTTTPFAAAPPRLETRIVYATVRPRTTCVLDATTLTPTTNRGAFQR